MDGPSLSGRERRLLEEIESGLRQDTRLDRKLSTMGARRPGRVRTAVRRTVHRIPAGVVLTALVMTAICLSVGVRTPTVAVLTALGVVWAASLAVAAAAAVLLRRRAGARRRDPLDRPDGPDRPEGRERRPWDKPEV
ncbi:hypothetical protein AB0C76_02890 [Kitasatospora sp. NPDC048722]|uniref:hypothetical protein n=1 Tax=Kitasatospora sp. NPDC048722 TaxID=3155639 RepID=UPI0033C6DB57